MQIIYIFYVVVSNGKNASMFPSAGAIFFSNTRSVSRLICRENYSPIVSKRLP